MSCTCVEDDGTTGRGVRCPGWVGNNSWRGDGGVRVFDAGGVDVAVNCDSKEATEAGGTVSDD